MNSAPTVPLSELLVEVKTELGDRVEPPILTLTEGRGFVLQSEKFKKRVATADTSRYRLLARGDISFNPFLLWAGALAENDLLDEAITSPVYPTFRSTEGATSRYIWHLLRSPGALARFDTISFGSVPRRRRASVQDFLATRIPMPPIEDQRRIAATLDQADELRAKRRRTLALLDEMQEAAFSSQFDPSATIFRVEQVGQHVSLRSGKFLPRKAMSPGEVPVFGGNGVNGHHDVAMFSEPKIVVGRVGAQCGAVHVTPDRSWVTDNAMVCTWDASALRLDYLADALRFARLNQFAATTDLRQLSASRVAAVPLAVPPLAVQDRYIAIVQRLGGARRSAEALLAHLDELFASLQHRAFTGQL